MTVDLQQQIANLKYERDHLRWMLHGAWDCFIEAQIVEMMQANEGKLPPRDSLLWWIIKECGHFEETSRASTLSPGGSPV